VFDRFSFVRDVFIRLCLGGFVFFTSACGIGPTTPDSGNPQITPTCVLSSLNPYRTHQPPNQVTNMFTNYRNGSISYEVLRQDALTQLGENIKQWSDYEDVSIDGRTVRIMITYLDPMLVQYILLNDTLVAPNNTMDQNSFTNRILTAMDRLANRNEVIFIVTIMSQVHENALYVDIPIKSLELISASGQEVRLTHYDPVLGEHNDISKKTVHGYISYPVSLSLPGGCTGVVDQWTTSLKLDYKSSLSQNHPFYSLFWNIPYQSLVVVPGNGRPIPTVDPFYDLTRFSKAETPPPPETLTNDDSQKTYWEDMGRYIWSKVIMMHDN
jgi:hypothetical protein